MYAKSIVPSEIGYGLGQGHIQCERLDYSFKYVRGLRMTEYSPIIRAK